MQNLVSLGLKAKYRESSQIFPIEAKLKLVTPGAGAKFDPKAIIWALLVEAH